MKRFQYLNNAAIAYLAVSVLTAILLAGIDHKLPLAFAIALFSPKFWFLFEGGFAVFIGGLALLMVVIYISNGRTETKQFAHGVVGALVCGFFFAILAFTLVLSGVK